MNYPPIVGFVFALTLVVSASAESLAPGGLRELTDVPYKQGASLTDYEQTRCKLDVYLPAAEKGFATLVWFHGGGLKNGDKNQTATDSVKTAQIARSLAAAGIAVVAPNYRLSPKVNFPAYVEDAAAAVAWTRGHIAEHGGDLARVFVGGHSAGGYLTLMLVMDPHFLADAGVKLEDLAGFIPVSGQVMTHYTILDERGLGKFEVSADAAAPVHFARAATPPLLVLYADHDMAARAEENAYFVALMKAAGNKSVTGQQIADRTHGSIASKLVNADDPARVAILKFIEANKAAH
ncbi:MAG: alpha/beta hydrolase [Chthoniobacteraceae bacterium]